MPARAASVSTLVVSWKLAAEMKLLDCTAALVMPRSCVLAVAGLGLLLWLFTRQPLLAIIVVIIVDFAGFWLTLVKTWHAPHSETLISWDLSLAGSVISLLAINNWQPAVYLYPAYAIAAQVLIIWIIIYRRRIVRDDPADF